MVSAGELAPLLRALGDDADVHMVGGSVREIATGQTPHDLDLASRLSPDEVVSRCGKNDIRVVETGVKHGTVTIVLSSMHVELTTFRHAGPHHENNFASTIEEDLQGRDFTINAMAVNLKERRFVDTQRGLDDLGNGTLRAVGEPAERFREDPLRLMRMIRFGAAAGRSTDARTESACAELVGLLARISPERINSELKRILISKQPAEGLRAMRRLGILAEVAPELLTMSGVEQNEFHTEDVFEHTLSVIERCPVDVALRLAALFHDSGKPATISTGKDGRRHFYEHEVVSSRIARSVMERLRFSRDETERVTRVVRMHMRPLECGPAGVRRIMRDVDPFYDDWRVFKFADAPPVMSTSEVEASLQRFDQMVLKEHERIAAQGDRLAIGGRDLMEIGFEPGVAMGDFLRGCEELVIENPDLNTREGLLERARLHLEVLKA